MRNSGIYLSIRVAEKGDDRAISAVSALLFDEISGVRSAAARALAQVAKYR